MLRTSRRKERAVRRRSQRVQRGGAIIKITNSFINRVVELIKHVDKSNLSEAQLAIVTDISNNKLSDKRQQALTNAILKAPSKMSANHFTNPVEGSIEKGVADMFIINTLLKIETPSGNNTSSQLEDQSNDEIQPDAAGRSSAEGSASAAPPATAPATAAPWYKVPDDRKADWEAAVAASDISNILLPVIQSGTITPPAYIELLARQNDIFKMAFDIIRLKLKEELKEDVTDAYILVKHSEAIKAKSEDLMKYINDAEQLIINSQQDGFTKLNSIRTQKEDIFELLLFPDRLQNLLVKAVANLCIMLVEDKNYALLKKSELSSILLKQYSSYAESLARSQTAIGIRDGYYLSQKITSLGTNNTTILSITGHTISTSSEALSNFWKDFILILSTQEDSSEPFTKPTDKPDKCDRYINGMSWGQIAANIFMQYKRGDFKEEEPYYAPILKLFAGNCDQKPTTLKPEYPNKSIWKLPLYNTITLEKAFDHVAPITLEFMLHLAYEITRAAKRAATEASAPPPPPSSEQAPSSSQGSGV